MRIDIHTHAWSTDYLDRLDAYLPGEPHKRSGADVCRGLGAGLEDKELEARFAGTEAARVDLEVLSVGAANAHFTRRDHAVSAARHANDDYAEAVAAWPNRFQFFAALPLPHIDDALAEIERALDLPGALGIALTTSILGTSPADPSLDPIYEELDRRSSVLYFHPEGAAAHSRLVSDSGITWMVGAPFEDTIAAVQLIIARVPARFPHMKIILSHLGGALPLLTRRLDDHVALEAPGLAEQPSLLARRMWYDTVAHNHSPALRCVVDTFGAGRLLLGTDFPYQSGDHHRQAIGYITDSRLPEQAATAILDHNAQNLLGL